MQVRGWGEGGRGGAGSGGGWPRGEHRSRAVAKAAHRDVSWPGISGQRRALSWRSRALPGWPAPATRVCPSRGVGKPVAFLSSSPPLLRTVIAAAVPTLGAEGWEAGARGQGRAVPRCPPPGSRPSPGLPPAAQPERCSRAGLRVAGRAALRTCPPALLGERR